MRVVLVALALLAGCGTAQAVDTSDGLSPRVQQQLLERADAVAAQQQGEARQVEAVRTTSGRLRAATGDLSRPVDDPVLVLQITGDDYTCTSCRRAPLYGGPPPSGTVLRLVLSDDEQLSGQGFSISGSRLDLAGYGEVVALR